MKTKKRRFRLAACALFLIPHPVFADREAVDLELRLIRLPVPLALEMLVSDGKRHSDGGVLFKRAMQHVGAGKGELRDQRNLSEDAAQRIAVADAEKYWYPTQYEVEGEGRRAEVIGVAKESREIGTVVGAQLSPKEDGAVFVSLAYTHHLAPPVERKIAFQTGEKRTELETTRPEFRYYAFASKFTTIPGCTTLVGAVSSALPFSAPQKAGFVDLLFATVPGKAPEKLPELATSELRMVVVSVPDALGPKIEAQELSDADLLAQLVQAVTTGKAVLEAFTFNHRDLRSQCIMPVRSAVECWRPKVVRSEKETRSHLPQSMTPIWDGVAAGAYVEANPSRDTRPEEGLRVPYWLELNFERRQATRGPDSSELHYDGAMLDLKGDLTLLGDSTTRLVDVSTKTVEKPRRYFTFVSAQVN